MAYSIFGSADAPVRNERAARASFTLTKEHSKVTVKEFSMKSPTAFAAKTSSIAGANSATIGTSLVGIR
jgi:hypothetical protein